MSLTLLTPSLCQLLPIWIYKGRVAHHLGFQHLLQLHHWTTIESPALDMNPRWVARYLVKLVLVTVVPIVEQLFKTRTEARLVVGSDLCEFIVNLSLLDLVHGVTRDNCVFCGTASRCWLATWQPRIRWGPPGRQAPHGTRWHLFLSSDLVHLLDTYSYFFGDTMWRLNDPIKRDTCLLCWEERS